MIYLDHAATSWPKPDAVVAAVQRWYTDVGVSAERGDGPRTREARDTVARARRGLAARTGHPAERVAFGSGATEGLNLVLRALLGRGARVVTTPFEHASVVRPLVALRRERDVDLVVAPSAAGAAPDEAALEEAIAAARPDVVVLLHASNVTGAVLDAARVCAAARAHGARTVLDVSQTAGYLPLDVGADVVVGSAHKALHGPPGLGFVTVAADLELAPQKQGGTGSSVALDEHPTAWPQAFEAGTPNTPAIFGLAAALDELDRVPDREQLARALARLDELERGLRDLPGFRLVEPGTATRTPVLSVVHDSYDPLELGAVLASADVHARAGFHCAPWIHERLGTGSAGTLRLSPGPQTSADDVARCLDVLRAL